MSTTITATFEITGWDEAVYDELADGPRLSRATVTKRFTGAIEGESRAELLMCVAADDNAGYLTSERMTGRIGDRSGTFVIQHGGVSDQGDARLRQHCARLRHRRFARAHWLGDVQPRRNGRDADP